MPTITSTLFVPPVSSSSRFTTSTVRFARPNDTAGYAVGDAWSDSTSSAACFAFEATGCAGVIRSVALMHNDSKTVDFDLHLYSAEPTNQTDNVGATMTMDDAARQIGIIYRFTSAQKTTLNGIDYYRAIPVTTVHDDAPRVFVAPEGRIYGLLVCRTIYTPVANAQVVIKLGIERE